MNAASADSVGIILVVGLGLIVVVSLAVVAFLAIPPLRRLLRQQSDNARLMASGTTAKATVLSAQQTGNSVEQAGFISFEVAIQLQVEPDGGTPFVATATQYVGVMEIAAVQPGATAMVRYDPSDTSQVAIASLGGSPSTATSAPQQDVARAHQLMMETEDLRKELGVRGVATSAQVLDARRTGIMVNDGMGEITHLSLSVTPDTEASFTVETVAALSPESASKVQLGATVTVLYDPEQPTRAVVTKVP